MVVGGVAGVVGGVARVIGGVEVVGGVAGVVGGVAGVVGGLSLKWSLESLESLGWLPVVTRRSVTGAPFGWRSSADAVPMSCRGGRGRGRGVIQGPGRARCPDGWRKGSLCLSRRAAAGA